MNEPQNLWTLLVRWVRGDPEILDHWYALVPNFQTSAQDFYALVEKELAARKLPGLDIARIEFREGGMLSSKREYLRLRRERLVFDVCAAPFGTAYFFSSWFAEIASAVKLWEALVFLFGLGFAFGLLVEIAGFWLGSFLFFVLLGVSIWVLRHPAIIGLRNLDDTLLKLPVIGPVYDRFFRKRTYWREDTRLMYLDTVTSVVQGIVEHVTSAEGASLVRFHERNASLRDLYQERSAKLEPTARPRKPPSGS